MDSDRWPFLVLLTFFLVGCIALTVAMLGLILQFVGIGNADFADTLERYAVLIAGAVTGVFTLGGALVYHFGENSRRLLDRRREAEPNIRSLIEVDRRLRATEESLRAILAAVRNERQVVERHYAPLHQFSFASDFLKGELCAIEPISSVFTALRREFHRALAQYDSTRQGARLVSDTRTMPQRLADASEALLASIIRIRAYIAEALHLFEMDKTPLELHKAIQARFDSEESD